MRSARVWLLGLVMVGLAAVPGRAEWRRSYNTSCDCNGASSAPVAYYTSPAPYVPPPTTYYTPQPAVPQPAPTFTAPQNPITYTPPAAMPSAPAAPTEVATATPRNTSNYTPQPQAPIAESPVPNHEMALAPPDGSVPIYNPPTPVKPGPPLTMPAPTESTAFAPPMSCGEGGCCGGGDACCVPCCESTSHPGLIARIKAHCAEKKAAREAAKCCCSPCDPCCTTAKSHPILDKIRAHHEAKKCCADPCEKKHWFKCFHKKKNDEVYYEPASCCSE